MGEKTKIIALSGKGGVGKTSLSACIVRTLVEKFPHKKILAIDADPAVGLATALGITHGETIDDIRKEVISNIEGGEQMSAMELLGEAEYRISDAITEKDGFAFIAIGRPESAGCYCKINSYLKDVIQILSRSFDYVVIDGEAGIEQINRRVMEKVTHLILVTDPTRKGLQVIKTINDVAKNLVMSEKTGVIVNRMDDMESAVLLNIKELPVLAYIPSDKELQAFDLTGQNVFYLPKDSFIVKGAEDALRKMEII